MHRDIGLNKVGLQWFNSFNYNMGDCLFDGITYLLKCSNRLKIIWRNNMSHLQKCLTFGTPQVLECCKWELNFEVSHYLYHGQANEETYIVVPK